ncbi:HNH endonuclease signature motif containing protein [Rhodococcus opacus]|nr:HNH endonuclease signature motif containing protein [Rhodococcus opacus]
MGVFDRGIRETVCCLVDGESDVGLVELMTDLHRSESVVAERKLAVIAELFVRRTAEVESDGAWTSTAHEVVEAEIGAALTMGRAAAGRLIGLGMSLRTRLHATREAMARGDLDMYRVRLIEDATANVGDDQIGEVEHQLLEQVLAPPRSGGTGLTGRRLTNAANRIIARLDPAGVRAKREKAQADRFVGVCAAEGGMCRILGSVPAAQGRAFDARLRELANTVCAKDLRAYEQRRADGLSALIDGAGFVQCECGRVDCGQRSRIATTARKPLVHLIMLDATLAGGDEPAYLDGYGIVDAAHAREIAADADVEPVRAPSSVVPTTYRPGTVLDTWMRVLAGGCEWLHCDVAAWNTDLDHHRPFDHSDPAAGGPTVAGNMTAYCRNHHRIKHSGRWWVTADGGIELVAPTGHRYRTRSSGLLGVGRSDAGGRDRDAGSDHAAAAVRRRARAQNTAARIRAERRRRRAHLDAVRRRSPGAQASGACPADEPSPF